jgi:uncharacterized protein (DUF1501 family)
MDMLGPPLDKAVSAFLDDLSARGLLDRVLLIITGDFGRTPTINARGGRDHFPHLSTLAFFGGGMGRGQIIGQSTRKNDAPATEPITLANLHSTVLHAQFDIGQMRLDRASPATWPASPNRRRSPSFSHSACGSYSCHFFCSPLIRRQVGSICRAGS